MMLMVLRLHLMCWRPLILNLKALIILTVSKKKCHFVLLRLSAALHTLTKSITMDSGHPHDHDHDHHLRYQGYHWETRRASTAWVIGRNVLQDRLFVELGLFVFVFVYCRRSTSPPSSSSSSSSPSSTSFWWIIRTRVQEGETDDVSNLGQTEVILHCCQIPLWMICSSTKHYN